MADKWIDRQKGKQRERDRENMGSLGEKIVLFTK